MFTSDRNRFYSEYLSLIKEPFQFISILMGFANLIDNYNNNRELIINNPILFDASCSGIQHLSAMTRDIEVARKVNILTEEELDNSDEKEILDKSRAQDYYLYAANNVQIIIDKLDNKNINNIKITRKMIKRTVMTIPYNITLSGVKEQLYKFFTINKLFDKYTYKLNGEYTKNNETLFLNPNEYIQFVNIVYNSLTQIPSLRNLSKYLNSILKIILELDKPII
jgi:DNA-directed RNA polymerase